MTMERTAMSSVTTCSSVLLLVSACSCVTRLVQATWHQLVRDQARLSSYSSAPAQSLTALTTCFGCVP